ncbi:MAG: AIR synthase family protein [candidate division KSB1 bacterium]|nr:AIR synthase family protein [candidate division KSB1 bacterium]
MSTEDLYCAMNNSSDSLPLGKLDHDLLDRLIKKYTRHSDRVIQGARLGEDATVIEMTDRYLICKTDPITFATDQIGYYAVHVNMNDIVCMGGVPKWFMASIILPAGTTQDQADGIFRQLSETCQQENVIYCGGHTEVTADVPRPIVSGHMIGETDFDGLILKKNARVGDRLVLAQPIAVEGTSIIAREHAAGLKKKYSPEFIKACQNMLFDPGISVKRTALTAVETVNVHAMHDPTEGGLATAVYELASAANLGVRLDRDRIPVLESTQLLCGVYNLDVLGLIASGSLLIACAVPDVDTLLTALQDQGIVAADIGELLHPDKGKRILQDGKETELPIFSQDEIVKVFS